ncbi:hypothetical protein [Alicyclobacillus sp. ALC3]|uniref:hypothetical protein n=1 Tax=Alicyclobacillus sp. ALC3 TaxID=2796143 RepID=UPI002378CC72|nr:hypothetical protein [Alicyclobacillus sp. ALC3]WDL97801.1 hypothetical protein JC200_03460 [Alicyclobacillus sp. ALC3]
MQVKYTGASPVVLPTLGKSAEPGDVIEVPDDFEHPQFAAVKTQKKKGGDDVDAATE